MTLVAPRIINDVSYVSYIINLSNFSFVHLLLQVFQQETLSSSNTDVIFLGSIDIMSEGTRTSIMRQPWIN